MSNWYEVFDNEEVQWAARTQATHLTALTAAAVLLTVGVASLGLEGWLPAPMAVGALVLLWLGTAAWVRYRLRRLRRLVWCMKLSEERVVGYDYTRRKRLLDWSSVHRVELARDGLLLVGDEPCTLEVPHLFPDFAALSHRVVHYADLHGVPIFIDGQPWQDLDVYLLFPFLAEDSSTGAPGAPAA